MARYKKTIDNGTVNKVINKRLQQFLIITILAGLAACGGGSGGGTNKTGGVASSNAPLNSSLASSSVPNLSPIAKIQFPRTNATPLASYNGIEVSGVAYDDKGIKTIKVNNVTAEITSYAPITRDANVPATHSYKASWSARINLPYGDTQVNVEVTDSDGLVIQNATAPLTIHNSYIAGGVLIDNANDRIIGSLNYGLNQATDLQTLISVSLPISVDPWAAAINKEGTEIYSAKVVNGFLKIYSTKINTGIDSILVNYDLKQNSEIHNWIDVESGTLSTDARFYFINLRYVYRGNGGVEFKILKIDLAQGSVSLLAAKEIQPMYKGVTQIAYVNNYLIAQEAFASGATNLQKIDAVTGQQTSYLSTARFDLLTINSDRTMLYGISYDKFVTVNLAENTEITKPLTYKGEKYLFPSLAYLVVDARRNRLIASISGMGEISAINLDSGEVSLLARNGIGEGLGIVSPSHLQVTSDDKFAYVIDDRLMAIDTLFKVDLSTGNRTVIANFDAYDNRGIGGLTLDEQNNRVFFSLGLSIGAVDLATNSYKIIASPEIGLGVAMETLGSITGLAYDKKNNKLLVSGWSKGAIVAVDTLTYNRTILFDSSIGAGPEIIGTTSILLDDESRTLYVSRHTADDKPVSIVSIDMNTGDRTLVLDKCVDTSGATHTIPSYEGELGWDKQTKSLFAIGFNVIVVHQIANSQCKIIPAFARHTASLSDSTLITLSVGLEQVNPKTGERAIISK